MNLEKFKKELLLIQSILDESSCFNSNFVISSCLKEFSITISSKQINSIQQFVEFSKTVESMYEKVKTFADLDFSNSSKSSNFQITIIFK